MIPDELFKPKHFGTPGSFYLITVNFIVLALSVQFFASCTQINWFFWVSIGLLAVYNVYQIRFYRDEYDKTRIIAYIISLIGMVFMFFVFRSGASHCN